VLDLSDALCAKLNLRRVPGGYEIVIPEYANIATDSVGVHAAGAAADKPAVIFEDLDGRIETLSYRQLDEAGARFATRLSELGVARGGVVALHGGARPETAIVHVACSKLGAIVATISQLSGPDTVHHILGDCGARVLVTQDRFWAPLRHLRASAAELRHVIVVGDAGVGETAFADCLSAAPFALPVRTGSRDPALLIYTSGSTGQPKGILHGHGLLHGYKTSLGLFFNLQLQDPGLVFWTPADWAWVGGLVDVVWPAWMNGHPVIASQHRFDAEWALAFMARHGVTHSLMTPTALKRLALIDNPRARFPGLKLRTVFTGGEALPGETLAWLENELCIVCNEGYGMSEVNHMIGNCKALRPIKPGSMGWEIPGHVAKLVDEEGHEVAAGEVGEVVTTDRSATLFLGYWKRPDLTAETRLGPWVRTRDLAVRDAEGYFWYRGRNDDLIKSAGYRIGPAEVEEVLQRHPAVAESAVIGVVDAARGQAVKAFVRLRAGRAAGAAMAEALQDHVRAHLAAYKTPHLIEFVDDFPLTSSGKVARAELRRREQARLTASSESGQR
jgi:acetyl-CoA synthetase